MRYLSAVLISFLFVSSVPAVELFRYLDRTDGREFEYIFETDEQSVAKTIDRDKAKGIAMEWIISFHGGPQIGSIESATLRQKAIPYWLVAIADTTELRRFPGNLLRPAASLF